MPQYKRESFSFYQVDRPVIDGTDEFLHEVEELSKILGMVSAGSVTEMIMLRDTDTITEVNEPRLQVRPLESSIVDVFRPVDLRMVLFRRVVRTSLDQSHELKLFESKVDEDDNFYRQLRYGNEDRLPLLCDDITYVDDKVYGRALALVPKSCTRASDAISRQVEACKQALSINTSLGKETRFEAGVIPFATVPGVVNDIAADRFLDVLREDLLPRKVTLGSVAAYLAFTVSNTLIAEK